MSKNSLSSPSPRVRRMAENTACAGLLLVAAALVAPFANLGNGALLSALKWVYAAGAIIYTAARCVGASDRTESARMRRLRRMEAWAGIAFIVGGCFWFYNQERLPDMAGPLAILRETILFSLAGALIQLIGSWMIVWQQRKEGGSAR